MKIGFLFPCFQVLGGVETLMFRMNHWLKRSGHSVTLITNNIIPPLESIENKIILNKRYNVLDDIWRAKYYLSHLKNLNLDVIKTFHIYDAKKGAILAEILNKPVKLICGVYTPTQFDESVMGQDIIKDYFEVTNKHTRLICFADSLLEIEKLNISAEDKEVTYFPLPVDCNKIAARTPKWGKIVSIGRIVDMKGYNFYMVNIVKELNKMGFNVEYHIYGDGEKKLELLNHINSIDAKQYVCYHGPSKYEDFGSLISDAYIFVGMGTSLIEASQCGVPSICAIPYENAGYCYGMFSEFPFDLHQQAELFKNKIKKNAFEEIKRILTMTKEEYSRAEEMTRERAVLWSTECRMRAFLDIINEAPLYQSKWYRFNKKRFILFIRNRINKIKNDWSMVRKSMKH